MSIIVFDEKILIKNFNKLNNISTIYYPLKSNSNNFILNKIKNIFNENNKYMISSFKHYKKLKKINIKNDKICLINPLINDKDIKKLYKKGIKYFTFDNLNKLKEFEKYIEKQEISLNIRISISEIFDIDSYLGCSLQECKEILDYIDNYKDITLSFYLPYPIKNKKDSIEKMLKSIKDNFNNYCIDFINIGGITEKNINKEILSLYKKELELKDIIIEPGYELLKNTSVLKSKIINNKNINNKNILIIENGIYSGLLDKVLYEKQFPMYIDFNNKIIKFLTKSKDDLKEILIFGSSADSKDFLGKYYLKESDFNILKNSKYIYIEDISSYFEDFITEYGKNVKIKIKEKIYEV